EPEEAEPEQTREREPEPGHGVDNTRAGNTLVVPSQPIIAPVGSDVTLPCQLDPVKDLRDMMVGWVRHDLTPGYIHIRNNHLDFLIDQNSLYLGRTSVSESRLQQGDMSLSLTRVRVSDGGKYSSSFGCNRTLWVTSYFGLT
uniref:Immunoglobulin V-set domain-containing protein n=1 Tax=Periophthalmus magnuspinnatus TaxID=409849 RepID=A0A3B4BL07_9GOBI